MFIGYINPANLMTLSGLTIALFGCLQSLKGELGAAMVCLMVAGICDLFDGFIARKRSSSDDESEFGKQLDTVSDMACFGVAPVIIAMHTGFVGFADLLIQAFYACSAALRLGYFNVHGMSTKQTTKYFSGLPVTYAALFFPVVFLTVDMLPRGASDNIIRATFLITGVLFILRVKIRKPGGVYYLIFPLLALVLSYYWILGK